MRSRNALATLLVALLVSVARADEFTPDNLFVGADDLDANQGVVVEFTPQGQYVRTLHMGEGSGATYGVTFGPDGLLYVADFGMSRIYRTDADGGVRTFVQDEPLVDAPDGLTFGPLGELWVAARDDDGLVRVDVAGTAGSVKLPGDYDKTPAVMTFTPSGRRILSSNSASELRVLDGFGNSPLVFGGAIDGYPANVIESTDGSLWVSDYDESRLRIFDADGSFQRSVVPPEFGGPYGLTRQSNGDLVVCDFDTNEIHFVRDEAVVRSAAHAGMHEPAYVVAAPYRFRAKVKGTVAQADDPEKKLLEKDVQVSIQPGTGTVMLRFTGPQNAGPIAERYGIAYVFRGHLARRKDDSKNALLHAALPDGVPADATGSVSLQLKGATTDDGRFALKKFSGTLTVTRGDDTIIASFQGVKALR